MHALYLQHVRQAKKVIASFNDADYRIILEDEYRIKLVGFLMGQNNIAFDKLTPKEAVALVAKQEALNLELLSRYAFFHAFNNENRKKSALLCCGLAMEMGVVDIDALYDGLMTDYPEYSSLPGMVKRNQWSATMLRFIQENLPLPEATV